MRSILYIYTVQIEYLGEMGMGGQRMWFLEGDPSFGIMIAVSAMGYFGGIYLMWMIHNRLDSLRK